MDAHIFTCIFVCLVLCKVCNESDVTPANMMILCDTCGQGYHFNCLNPTMLDPPEEDWHCRRCLVRRRKISQKGKAYDQIIHNFCRRILKFAFVHIRVCVCARACVCVCILIWFSLSLSLSLSFSLFLLFNSC